MGIRLKRASLVLEGIELVGPHGQDEAERRRGSRFRVDAVLEGDFANALETDSLEDTIDYRRVVEVIRKASDERPRLLVESLAHAVAAALLERLPRVERVSLRVAKLDPPGLGDIRAAAVDLVAERE